MSERSIVITENEGSYQIHNSVLNEFELLGILEQIIFDLKHSKSPKTENGKAVETKTASAPSQVENNTSAEKTVAPPKDEKLQETAPKNSAASAELKTRIGNAVKAIKDLGGKVDKTDLDKMSAEELQLELEELTAQYKRLKAAKS